MYSRLLFPIETNFRSIGIKFVSCFYSFISCIKGKLVEVNEELVSRPHLLLEKV